MERSGYVGGAVVHIFFFSSIWLCGGGAESNGWDGTAAVDRGGRVQTQPCDLRWLHSAADDQPRSAPSCVSVDRSDRSPPLARSFVALYCDCCSMREAADSCPPEPSSRLPQNFESILTSTYTHSRQCHDFFVDPHSIHCFEPSKPTHRPPQKPGFHSSPPEKQ
jgi:hypothetical protein